MSDLNSIHNACMFRTECRKAADRIAELEAENAQLKQWRIDMAETNMTLVDECNKQEQEVARLSNHIRAIAEHHESKRDDAYKFGYPQGEEYHTERRDFALSIFTKGE